MLEGLVGFVRNAAVDVAVVGGTGNFVADAVGMSAALMAGTSDRHQKAC